MRQFLEQCLEDGYDYDEADAESPTTPIEGEVRIPILKNNLGWYHYWPCCSSTPLNEHRHKPPPGLEEISEHTWREFWEDMDQIADLLAILIRLDIWFWIILVPLFIVRGFAEYYDPEHEFMWDIIFWCGVLGVPLTLIGVDMYITYGILKVDPDVKLREMCIEYMPKFHAQGFHVDYRKELHRQPDIMQFAAEHAEQDFAAVVDPATDASSLFYCCYFKPPPVVRFVRFRKLEDLEKGINISLKNMTPSQRTLKLLQKTKSLDVIL